MKRRGSNHKVYTPRYVYMSSPLYVITRKGENSSIATNLRQVIKVDNRKSKVCCVNCRDDKGLASAHWLTSPPIQLDVAGKGRLPRPQ
jgi:hypothetical protein